jgi:phosphate transport system substrate-binding protein
VKRNRLLGAATAVAVLSTLGGMTANAEASSANGTLLGAGSTLIAPLMSAWTADFGDLDNIGVTYGAVGSGAGIAQITARTVDFGASDAPLSPAQAAACNGCVQIPWALTATGVAFHLNGISYLRLSGPVLASIYLGTIKMWNDPQIKKLNPHTALPALAITPAFRSDGSGDTYAFTDYLSRVSPAWRSQIGFATAVSFPAGVGGKGNDGITAVVSSTNGAIGYISASYIIAHQLHPAALKNAAGKYELPNITNIKNAASQVKSVPANNELHIVNPPAKYKIAYPLSTFSYVIVPKSSPQHTNLYKFISYALTTGQKFGLPLDFSPVPHVVLSAGIATAKTISG